VRTPLSLSAEGAVPARELKPQSTDEYYCAVFAHAAQAE